MRATQCWAGPGGVSVDSWVNEIDLSEVDPERLADECWVEEAPPPPPPLSHPKILIPTIAVAFAVYYRCRLCRC